MRKQKEGREPARDTFLCLTSNLLRNTSGSASSHAQGENEVFLTTVEYSGTQGGIKLIIPAHCLTKYENECQEEETAF